MRLEPETRIAGKKVIEVVDGETGEVWRTAKTGSGRLIEKNRSEGWRGYKSHLTKKQRAQIRWALRQMDRGIARSRVFEALKAVWISSPMQYPLTPRTIGSWQGTRAAMAKRGKEWP